jgi:hypothetical protein
MKRFRAKLILIAVSSFFVSAAPAFAADKVTMSSTNPTAMEMDQMEQNFYFLFGNRL